MSFDPESNNEPEPDSAAESNSRPEPDNAPEQKNAREPEKEPGLGNAPIFTNGVVRGPPKFCMQCGVPVVDPNATFCISCGQRLDLTPESIFVDSRQHEVRIPKQICPNCGTQIFTYKYSACPHCGTPLERPHVDPRTVQYSPGWSIGMPIISVGLLFLVLFVSDLIYLLTNPNGYIELLTSTNYLILGLFLELFFIIPPFLFLRRYFPPKSTKERFSLLGLPLNERSSKKIAKEIGIGALVGAGMLGFVTLMGYLAPPGYGGESVNIATSWQLVLICIGCFGAVGVSEEILFRGFTQRGLVNAWGKTTGIFVTAIMFSFAHFTEIFVLGNSILVTVLLFATFFVISLIFGYLRQWRKGNLVANIIAHGFYDSLVFMIAFFGI